MSGSERWKEHRIRQEVYVQQLKHTDPLSEGVSLSKTNSQGQTPALLLRRIAGNRSFKHGLNRTKKNRLGWIMFQVTPIVAGVMVRLSAYLGQFGITPAMSLPKPEVKDHCHDIDDIRDKACRSGN